MQGFFEVKHWIWIVEITCSIFVFSMASLAFPSLWNLGKKFQLQSGEEVLFGKTSRQAFSFPLEKCEEHISFCKRKL